MVKYRNGNYDVFFDLGNGTKIRSNTLDYFEPNFPESMDVKITNRCDKGCPYCHEDSTSIGNHGDIISSSFLDTLHPYTELAIGGGNVLCHPDLLEFLIKCKERNLICNITLNQDHFMNSISFVKYLADSEFIHGLGVSLTDANDQFIDVAKQFSNLVVHVINGIVSMNDLGTLADNGLKILILGYKEFRRGNTYCQNEYAKRGVETNKWYLYHNIETIIKDHWFKVVSFDNLAISQLEPKRFLTKDQWSQMFMGDDGFATMYVDMVKQEFALNSTSTDRYPLKESIVEMFQVVHKKHHV